MQAGRCGCHCLIASSMNTWWKCSHSSIRLTSAGQRHEAGCDTHAPAASPKSGLLGNSAMNFSHRILSHASAVSTLM